MKAQTKKLFLWGLLLLPYCGVLLTVLYYEQILSKNKNAKVIIVSKEDMELTMFDYKGSEIMRVPVACGEKYGNKQKSNDKRTPEGVFRISQIQDASSWKHDFMDGKGEIKGAYGNYFIRLNTPGHKGIGIHGTHVPQSIGTRITEGCIRLSNKNLEKLVSLIDESSIVIITTSKNDAIAKYDD